MKLPHVASILLISALSLPLSGFAAEPGQSFPVKTYVKDSAITTTVKAELAKEMLSSLVHISVETDSKGAVTLGGTATNKTAVAKAIAITRGVKGVTSVDSTVTIMADK